MSQCFFFFRFTIFHHHAGNAALTLPQRVLEGLQRQTNMFVEERQIKRARLFAVLIATLRLSSESEEVDAKSAN